MTMIPTTKRRHSVAFFTLLVVSFLLSKAEGRIRGRAGKNEGPKDQVVVIKAAARARGSFVALEPEVLPPAFQSRRGLADLVGLGADPKDLPLQLCEGDCDVDDDCEGDLICFQRGPRVAVPGCIGGESETSNTDFCIYPESNESNPPTLDPSQKPATLEAALPKAEFVGNNGVFSTYPLQNCQGDCDDNDDCADGLICYQRDQNDTIPGCSGTDLSHTDYCTYPLEGETEAPTQVSTSTATELVDDGNAAEQMESQTGSPTESPTQMPTTSPMDSQESTGMPTALPTKRPSEAPTTDTADEELDTDGVLTTTAPTTTTTTTTEQEDVLLMDSQTGSPTISVTDSQATENTNTPTALPTKRPSEAPTTDTAEELLDMMETQVVDTLETQIDYPGGTPTASPTKRPSEAPTGDTAEELLDMMETQVAGNDNPTPAAAGTTEMLEAKLVGNNGGPFFPLQRCQADCDSNTDCDLNLICYQRRQGEPIPGCITTDAYLDGIDFCVDPADISAIGSSPSTAAATTTTRDSQPTGAGPNRVPVVNQESGGQYVVVTTQGSY